MHQNALRSLILLVALATLAAVARADSISPPSSYSKTSPDGRFLFVMIYPGTFEDDLGHWNETKAAQIRALRRTYPQSGLYPNDGSVTPLWTVNWYSSDVDVASDGVHLVRRGPWISRTDQEAFSFFAAGRLLRTYAVSDLIDLPFLLPHSVSHLLWSEGHAFDDAALRYLVSTKDGNSFVFDVNRGAIVQEKRDARVKLRAAVGAAAAVLVVLTVLLFRRRKMREVESKAIHQP